MSGALTLVPSRRTDGRCRPLGRTLAIALGSLVALVAMPARSDEPQTELVTVSCASEAGARQHCDADVSGGVALAQSTGTAACLLGYSWGYDATGVWVTEGCSGVFVLGQSTRIETPGASRATAHENEPSQPETPQPEPSRIEPPEIASATPEEEAELVESTAETVETDLEARRPTDRIETWSVYEPGTGYLLARTGKGELAISGYAMGRYMDQVDGDGVFTDHLGRVRPVDGRNDIFSHRIMVFLKGWMVDPKMIYTITFWTVNTTDQDAIFANLGYQFSRHFSLYIGLTGNPGSRSLLGSHPYWLGHDRVMADEFFRPYFGSGIYAAGEALPGLWYNVTLSNNNSALGVKATQLDRKYTWGGSVWWMPTTEEFGPRGAYGDWEHHDHLATRFGISFTNSPEQSFRNSSGVADNTTLRLADSVNLFETGSLAPDVTIDLANYRVVALDAGMKYRGVFLQAEYYRRWLDNFVADGALPVDQIIDQGFYLQAAFYPIPKVLEVYGITSQIYGDEDAGFRRSWEYGGGMNWYPFDTRNHRLNLQILDVTRSPVSSVFGYYTGGLEGTILSSSFSLFF